MQTVVSNSDYSPSSVGDRHCSVPPYGHGLTACAKANESEVLPPVLDEVHPLIGDGHRQPGLAETMVVTMVALLFAGWGSVTLLVTENVLSRLPEAVGRTSMTTVAVLEPANEPISQMTVVVPLHAP